MKTRPNTLETNVGSTAPERPPCPTLAPLPGCNASFQPWIRGYRFAQPPATVWQPFGLPADKLKRMMAWGEGNASCGVVEGLSGVRIVPRWAVVSKSSGVSISASSCWTVWLNLAGGTTSPRTGVD
jgi:hypothetical protein